MQADAVHCANTADTARARAGPAALAAAPLSGAVQRSPAAASRAVAGAVPVPAMLSVTSGTPSDSAASAASSSLLQREHAGPPLAAVAAAAAVGVAAEAATPKSLDDSVLAASATLREPLSHTSEPASSSTVGDAASPRLTLPLAPASAVQPAQAPASNYTSHNLDQSGRDLVSPEAAAAADDTNGAGQAGRISAASQPTAAAPAPVGVPPRAAASAAAAAAPAHANKDAESKNDVEMMDAQPPPSLAPAMPAPSAPAAGSARAALSPLTAALTRAKVDSAARRNQLAGAAAAAEHAPAAAPAPIITKACHCLQVDAGRVSSDSDKAELAAALSQPNDDALRTHVRQWMPALQADGAAVTVYVQAGCLHINFSSHAALGAAQLAEPKLVRCGAHSRPWLEHQQCGLQRHEQPELLQLFCRPTAPEALDRLAAVTDALLEAMGLAGSVFWTPSAHNPMRPGRGAVRNLFV